MPNPPSIKITMLGTTSAGKTCFMLGMYAVMRLGYDGFSFSAKNPDVDVELTDAFERLVDKGAQRWPQPSELTTEYALSMNYGLRPLANFDWLDYRGGALNEQEAVSADTGELRKFLFDSDSVVICISGEYLLPISVTATTVATRARVGSINQHLTDLRNRRGAGRLPTVTVVVTKYDKCRAWAGDEQKLVTLLKRVFNALFTPGGGWSVMICPVSLGMGLADDLDAGEIDPVNVHLPVTFALLSYFKRRVEELSALAKGLEMEHGVKSGNILKRMLNSAVINGLLKEQGMTEGELKSMKEGFELLRQQMTDAAYVFEDGQQMA